jgi:hypothetical protein
MSGADTAARRKSPRAKVSPNEIIYLSFQSGNGAIVLDVSSEGFGIQAADPLQLNELLSFRLSARASPDIALSAQVAWLDATRKRGGLHLSVPAEARPTFDQWQRKYVSALPKVEDVRSPAPVPTAPASPLPPPKRSQAYAEKAVPSPEGAPLQAPFGARSSIFVSEWEAPPEESHTLRNALMVCMILGLAVAGLIYVGGRRQVGAFLIRLGETIGGTTAQTSVQTAASQDAVAPEPSSSPDAKTRNQAPAPLSTDTEMRNSVPNTAELTAPELSQPLPAAAPPSPQQASRESSNGPFAAPATPLQSEQPSHADTSSPSASKSAVNAALPADISSSQAAAPTSANRSSQAAPAGSSISSQAASSTPGQAEVEQARKYLQDSNPADAALAANLLWSAIEAGNTQAEVILGDLYLRGQGAVQKNCAQAQALLTAAQSANVAGASEKLQELQTYGCR